MGVIWSRQTHYATSICSLGAGYRRHMKCKRSVCGNKKARVIDLGELGTVILGCPHTPVLGSRFCFHCRRSAAHCKVICQPSVPDKPVQTSQVASTSDAAAGAPQEDDADPVDEATETGGADQISKSEEDVYLVRRGKATRIASSINEDAG